MCNLLLGDNGYDSDDICNDLAKHGIEPVILPRANRTTPAKSHRAVREPPQPVPPHRDPLRKNGQSLPLEAIDCSHKVLD
jgi:hypothetical protein